MQGSSVKPDHPRRPARADMMVRWVREEIGTQQVSTVVTDNGFGMDFARELAVKEPRLSHVLPLRCACLGLNACELVLQQPPIACTGLGPCCACSMVEADLSSRPVAQAISLAVGPAILCVIQARASIIQHESERLITTAEDPQHINTSAPKACTAQAIGLAVGPTIL